MDSNMIGKEAGNLSESFRNLFIFIDAHTILTLLPAAVAVELIVKVLGHVRKM